MTGGFAVYRRWLRDRRWSMTSWIISTVLIIVVTAAFYPSMNDLGTSLDNSGAAMDALMGLGEGIDPSSPLGYLWIGLYANVYPWMLMSLGASLGCAAIAGDEDTGSLEYLLSNAVTRTTVLFARFAAVVTILFVVTFVSALSLVVTMPLFELTDEATLTSPDGSPITAPGATVGDVAAGTLAAFAIALGLTGIAFLVGAVTGRKSIAVGVAAGVGVGGYVLYTLSSMTTSLDAIVWLSPWRWYVGDAMLINGLSSAVLLPFATATVSLLVGWQVFLHRDLRGG